MKPFMKYPGGKTKEVPLVRTYMPLNIERYFEPFVGGGSVYFDLNIHPSFINDFSFDLINLYTLVQQQDEALHNLLIIFDNIWHLLDEREINQNDLIGLENFLADDYLKNCHQANARKQRTIRKLINEGHELDNNNINNIRITARKTAFYMMVRKQYNLQPNNNAMRAATYFFLREYCYSSMFRFSNNGEFNVPYGGMSYNNKFLINKIDEMFSVEMHNYMADTTIQQNDFEDFLNQYEFNDRDFIFLDPPYDSDFSTYDQNPFDRNEQIRLRDFLTHTNAKWMLIIKKTDFINKLYRDFHVYEYGKNYMVSFKNRNDKNVSHLLITNYQLQEVQ